MNPIWGHIVGVITVAFMAIFIGIWIWAWRKKHQPTFSRMAEMPMRDEQMESAQDNDEDDA